MKLADGVSGHVDPMVSYRNTTRYVTKGWERAVAEDLVRPTVARPPNRSKAAPTHTFRSGFIANMAAAGVSDAVLDHLVGHAPGSVRGMHYATPSMGMQREAVKAVPAMVRSTA